jgi:hypothetical protein
MKISSIAKSIVADLAAGATAVQDGSLSTGEGVTIVLAVLGAWASPTPYPTRRLPRMRATAEHPRLGRLHQQRPDAPGGEIPER